MKKFNSKIFLIFLALMMIATAASAEVMLNRQNNWKAKQHFDKGVTVNGVEVIPNVQFSKEWFVCSVNGADTLGNGYGTTYEKPFATLEYAISQLRAGYGDVVWVLPSHNEGITSAAAIDFDIAGMFVIGIGQGDDKPTIDFDHADASVAIGADDVTVANIRFRCSANAVTVGLDVEDGSDYAHIVGCEFGWAETATDEFAISLRTGDASNFATIEKCIFQAGAQAAVTAWSLNKDTDHTVFRDNWITGTYSTAPILGATTASTNLLISGNYFYTGGTADTFNLVAASTGFVVDNNIVMNAASAAAALDIGNCIAFRNFLMADDDVGGDNEGVTASGFASVSTTADD